MVPSSGTILVQATGRDTRRLESAQGLGSETLDPKDLTVLWLSNQGLQVLSSDSFLSYPREPPLPSLSFTSLLPAWPLQDGSAVKSQMLCGFHNLA